MTLRASLMTIATLAVIVCAASATAEPVPSGYRRIAAEYGVPAAILYAIGLTESKRRINVGGRRVERPWPWTLNVGGKGHYYETREDAWQALEAFRAQGRRSIDIGLMQVNWHYNGDRLKNPYSALDPYYNLRVAAQILRDCHEASGDWWAAVGCYHSPGKTQAARQRAQRYRARVRRHWRRLDG